MADQPAPEPHRAANRSETPRDRQRRDCHHPGQPHQHGTRAAYIADRCGCISCRVANSDAERRRIALLAAGDWVPLVPAEPAAAHVAHLRALGFGLDRIARLSAVPVSTIRRLAKQPQDRPRLIRAETSRRLLDTQPERMQLANRAVLPAGQTRNQLQRLLAAGLTLPELAQLTGKSPTSLRRSMTRERVTVSTANAVDRAYVTALQNHLAHPGPTPHLHHRGPVTQGSRTLTRIARPTEWIHSGAPPPHRMHSTKS